MKLRKIVIGNDVYLWGLKHRYQEEACHYTFTSYLEGRKTSPLLLMIKTWADARGGGPLQVGARIDLTNAQSPSVNLNEPKTVSKVIRYARSWGWDPERTRSRFVVQEGLPFLLEAIGKKVST